MITRTPDGETIDRRESTVTHEAGTPPSGATQAAVPPVYAPHSARTERVIVDYATERQAGLVRATRLIQFVFGVIVALIAIRVLLELMAANPASPFAQFIYGLTDVFVAPFIGLTGTPAANGFRLDAPAIIAAIIYALGGWALITLLWLLFYRPATRSVSTQTYQRD